MIVKDLVHFVEKHRRGNAFKGYSEIEIASEILQALDNGTMCFVIDKDDHTIIGLVTAYHMGDNILNINNILTIRPNLLPVLVDKLQELFPHHALFALRHGKKVFYNTVKLKNKIWAARHQLKVQEQQQVNC